MELIKATITRFLLPATVVGICVGCLACAAGVGSPQVCIPGAVVGSIFTWGILGMGT